MTKQIPSYLKLVTDTNAEAPAVASEDLAAMAHVARTFTQATGWQLSVDAANVPAENSSLMWSAPVNPGVGNSPGHIGLFHSSNGPSPRVDLEDAAALADSIGNLWSELIGTRRALRLGAMARAVARSAAAVSAPATPDSIESPARTLKLPSSSANQS